MIKRNIEPFVRRYAREYPVVAVVGPRQSGKTTLARALFPGHAYMSLENIDTRSRALEDPRGFLADAGEQVIIDEAQRAPDLFSYLQERVDVKPAAARYVLTGSQHFLMMEKIAQSLAGRIFIAKLFPFTYNELYAPRVDSSIESILSFPAIKGHAGRKPGLKVSEIMFGGMYPRIHDKRLDAHKWLEGYVETCVERDVRQIINVQNLRTFENLLRVCASLSGQLVNYSSMSNALGVTIPTVKSWVSLLETSGIVFILPPHSKSFAKRVVKTPKLYFVDTGVLCFLLGVRRPGELKTHPLYGNIFETFVVSEIYKRMCHVAERPPLFFWRDKTGNEIDLVLDLGAKLFPIEIKSSRTYSASFADGIRKWHGLKGNTQRRGLVVYDGEEAVGTTSNIPALPWWRI